MANAEVSFAEIDAPHGHDAFLLETEVQGRYISNFLSASAVRDAKAGVDGSAPYERKRTNLPASIVRLEELQRGGGVR